jgi:hypothetical protein
MLNIPYPAAAQRRPLVRLQRWPGLGHHPGCSRLILASDSVARRWRVLLGYQKTRWKNHRYLKLLWASRRWLWRDGVTRSGILYPGYRLTDLVYKIEIPATGGVQPPVAVVP